MTAVLEKQKGRTPGPCPVIESVRLRLRPHRMDDAEAIAHSLSDFQVSRMLARVPQPYDRQDALDWLNRSTGDLSSDWTLAITERDDVHIGVVGLELRHGQWHLGYWLDRYYWGRGMMSEAVSATVERFCRRMPETVLHSGVFADNRASLRIQEKIGFTVTGCSEIYCRARNALVPHLETRLSSDTFRPAR